MAATEVIQEPDLLTTATRLVGGADGRNADRAVEAIGRAMEVVEPEDRELALLLEADRAAYAQQASLDTRAPVVAQLERHGQLDGSTPGERLVLASLAFERARASESATEAVAFIEGVLADGRLLGEQAVDVAGTHYLLLVGLLATDAWISPSRARSGCSPTRGLGLDPGPGVRDGSSGLGLVPTGRNRSRGGRRANDAGAADGLRHQSRDQIRARASDRGADRGWRVGGRRAGSAHQRSR